MPRLKIEDLQKIKKRVQAETALTADNRRVRVTVHMGTCGIACGALRVFSALIQEIKDAGATGVAVTRSGCMGFCAREPLVTVEIFDQEPIIYEYIDEEKISQI